MRGPSPGGDAPGGLGDSLIRTPAVGAPRLVLKRRAGWLVMRVGG
ncbi:hypothetical protein RKD18_005164 [Streptomyces phaeoluteigriseus]